jgi:hypothetical protein
VCVGGVNTPPKPVWRILNTPPKPFHWRSKYSPKILEEEILYQNVFGHGVHSAD